MAPMIFKTYHDLDEYLKECDMIDLEELTDTILQGTEEEEED